MSIFVAPRPKVSVPQKAATGPGVNYYYTDPPLSAIIKTPQERMRRAMSLGISVPWIRASERVITGLGSTVPWHLEDADDTEIDDEYNGLEEQRARRLLEYPQELVDVGVKMSRREMWALTLRHMGLTGNAFWLDDTPDPDGLPGSLLYIRPDRMTPAPDKQGNLRGWVLDYDGYYGGTPLTLDTVHHFTLEPPDEGFLGVGLVESALNKAALSGALDTYLLQKIQAGGRRSGILAPKTGIIEPDVYDQLINDWRTASEANDAARRLQVVRAPVDFHDTGIDELTTMLRDFMTGARDDLLGLWGVPASKLGLHDRGKGLGATAATDADDETLWEIAIDPRLTAFTETVQMTLLDDFQRIGVTVELELETPDFGDDTPQYEKGLKAISQPLTRNERRYIINLDPLPDYGPDGQPLGLAIDLPLNYVVVGQGPEPNGGFALAPAPEPVVSVPPTLPPPMPQLMAGKAKRETPTMRLRARVEAVVTPKLRKDLSAFLAEQKRDIATKLRAHASHLTDEPKDTQVWFKPEKWDRKLAEVLRPHLAKMAQSVSDHIAEAFPVKAEGAIGAVERVLNRGAARVTGINQTTRDAIAELIATTIAQGGSVNDAADALEDLGAFDDYRAELIARTELMDAYNGAALGSYSDAGLSQVEAIDGDGDPECAERDGQVFDIEEADAIEDHPNGTLDWMPVLEQRATRTSEMEQMRATLKAFAERPEPEHRVSVEGPTINIPPPVIPEIVLPEIRVPETVVNLPPERAPRTVRKVVERDETGRIIALVETEL